MYRHFVFSASLTLTLLGSVLVGSHVRAQEAAKSEIKDLVVTIVTEKGEIVCDLYASKTPLTAASFANLALRGFYDGITFHRVIPNFVIQGGDPTASGSGGPGYKFEDETLRGLKHSSEGILSMANSDRPGSKASYSNRGSSNGSQFFITHRATPHLDGLHTVFGKVTKGMDVVNSIRKGDKIKTVKVEGDVKPLFKKVEKRLSGWNKILDRKKYKKAKI